MTEHFAKLISYTKPQIQEFQRTLSRINAKKTKLWHIIFKLQKIKDKEKNSKKSQRKKKCTLPIEEQRKELNLTSLKPCRDRERKFSSFS